MDAQASSTRSDSQLLSGSLYAIGAFGLWGAFPIYFAAVSSVPPGEILAHRIVWSELCVAVLLFVFGQWHAVRTCLADWRTVMALAGSAVTISISWFVFIWAVVNEQVLEASLGYYITPLVSVVFGRLVLGERLRGIQWFAVGLAAFGVAFMLVQFGTLPWVALVLAITFCGYGLMRKIVSTGAMPGLLIETLMMSPLALAYLALLSTSGDATFAQGDAGMDFLLIAGGAVTAAPLIFYSLSVKRLRMAAVGLFQYITPTGQMLIATLLFGEMFTSTHLVTFGAIWLALALYSYTAFRGRNTAPPAVRDV